MKNNVYLNIILLLGLILGFKFVSSQQFPDVVITGDSNLNKRVELSDAINVLSFLFKGVPLTCQRSIDVDDNGIIDLADAISILQHLFIDGRDFNRETILEEFCDMKPKYDKDGVISLNNPEIINAINSLQGGTEVSNKIQCFQKSLIGNNLIGGQQCNSNTIYAFETKYQGISKFIYLGCNDGKKKKIFYSQGGIDCRLNLEETIILLPDSQISFDPESIVNLNIVGAGYLLVLGTKGDDIIGDNSDPNIEEIFNQIRPGDIDVSDPTLTPYDVIELFESFCGREGVQYTTINIGNGGNNRIIGTPNSDILIGGAGSDLIGGLGSTDCLIGGSGKDGIGGMEGDDIIYGGSGGDLIVGHIGNDFIKGEGGSDTIEGNEGWDEIYGGSDDDEINGGDENDLLIGGDGVDRIRGEDGEDDINGGKGDDIIWGGNLKDLIWGDIGDDTIYGDAGDDVIWGESGNDFISGGDGEDTIYGGEDNDEIYGEGDNDIIEGNDGDDYLCGGAGEDNIKGGSGADKAGGEFDKDTIDMGGNNKDTGEGHGPTDDDANQDIVGGCPNEEDCEVDYFPPDKENICVRGIIFS